MRTRVNGGLGQGRQVIASVAISGFGTWAYNVGITVYAYDRTHSAGWVAAVTVGRYVPALVLSWLAGPLVDQLPRRALAVAADAACAAVMVVLALLASADAPLWIFILVAAISSTMARVQASAVLSLAADVVVESQLGRASILASAAEAVASAVGSAAAAIVLIRHTPQTLFVINAATFAVSALLVAGVRSVRTGARATRPGTETAAERTSHVMFWPLQATRSVAALVYGMDVVLLAVVANQQLHSGTSGYGWLLAAAGAGGLMAVVPSRRFGGRVTATLTTCALLLYAVPLAAFALDPGSLGAVGIQIIRGVGSVLVISGVMSGLQRTVPSRISGQVFSETQSLVLAGTTVGAVVAPALLGAIGLDSTLLVAAAAPAALQVAILPFLVRFGRQEAGLLAGLEPRVTTLRGLELLQDASRSTLYEIADSVEDVVVQAGTVVVQAGDDSDAFYVLVVGDVEVTNTAGRILRQMTDPDYFGEIGLIRRTPRTATVTAVTPCELWRIPADAFLSALSEAGVSGALSDTVHFRFQNTPAADQWVPSRNRTQS